MFHANINDKKLGVIILVSDKIDFKAKAVKEDKGGQYIMIKGSIQEASFHLSTYMYLTCMHVCSVVLILSDPMDCSPLGFSVHGILQAGILEWVAIPFSRGYFPTRKQPGFPALQVDSLT